MCLSIVANDILYKPLQIIFSSYSDFKRAFALKDIILKLSALFGNAEDNIFEQHLPTLIQSPVKQFFVESTTFFAFSQYFLFCLYIETLR